VRLLVGLIFAAVLTPLGLRLMLPFVELPDFLNAFRALLTVWTDLLVIPFVVLDAGRFVRDFLPPVGAFARLEPNIVAAFVGWSIVQAVVMAVLGLMTRRSGGAG